MRNECAAAGRNERGAAATELVLLVPVIVLLLGAIVAGGRIWLARSAVADAASGAARAATLSRSAGEAQERGQRTAALALSTSGLSCIETGVNLDTSAFAVPAGTPATVTADVRCVAGLSDVAFPGLPGQITLSTRGSSALDTFRERR